MLGFPILSLRPETLEAQARWLRRRGLGFRIYPILLGSETYN